MKIAAGYQPILTAITNFQCMTVLQLANLFSMNIKVMQKKVRKLHNYGYLERTKLPGITSGNSPYLYYFHTSKPRFNYRLFSHQLKNTDIMIQIILSFKESPIHCDVLPEHLIRIERQEIVPDGSFTLKKNNKRVLFLLENCSGTMTMRSPSYNEDIDAKIIRYTEDLFRNNNTKFYSDFFSCDEFNRFRLLFITNNTQRLRAISEIIKEHDNNGFIWITTLKEFKHKGICNPIWQAPGVNKNNLSII